MKMHKKLTKIMIVAGILTMPVAPLMAGSINGIIGAGEYQWNTDAPANGKWNTDGHAGAGGNEYNDGSGGDRYDLNFLGIDTTGGNFQFGVVGGSILTSIYSGGGIGTNPLYISDIAINVLQDGETYVDPTQNTVGSDGWDYAVRILSIDNNTGTADFQLLGTTSESFWQDIDIYGYENNGSTSGHQDGHHSDTFRLENAEVLATFSGSYANNGDDENVLEGSFDLGLLGLFDEATGGSIITYLTMSCVNDETIVYADVSPVPLPAAVWLFGSALIGFIGMSRRTRV